MPQRKGNVHKLVRPTAAAEQSRIDQILLVAASVFARHGYRNTDVQVIADELGIGKATIYRKFPTKQELFLAAVDRGMERLSEHLDQTRQAAGGLEPLERLKMMVRAYFKFFQNNPDLVELFFQERAEFRDRPQMTYFRHRDKNMEKGKAFLQELVASGKIRHLSVEALLDVLSQTMYGTLFVHFLSRSNKTLDQRADDVIEVFVDGLRLDQPGDLR